MTNNTVQIVGLVLALIGGLCTTLAVILPEWRRNDVSDEILEAIRRHQGLWIRCISYPTGLWTCDDYDSFFLGLPTEFQVARGLSLSAIATIVLAIPLSIIGMSCTNCLAGSKRTKSRVSLAASICWIISSLFIGIASALYAHDVAKDFGYFQQLEIAQNNRNLGIKYVFGSCLFLAWAGFAVGVIGGAIMACGSCYSDTDEDEYWRSSGLKSDLKRVRNSFRESFRTAHSRKSGQAVEYV